MKSYKEFTQLDEGNQAKLRAKRALDRGYEQKASAEDKERKAKPAITPPKFSPAPRHARKAPLPQDTPRHSRTAMRNKQAPKPEIKKVSSPADKGREMMYKKPAGPRQSNYGDRLRASTKQQASKNLKNTRDKFSADNIGKKIANAPGNAARGAGKAISRGFRNSMKPDRAPNLQNGNVETLQTQGAKLR